MITNTGKAIIGKYLIGEASSYGSYIAVGCGAKPLTNAANIVAISIEDNYKNKKFLEFEMLRVPVISSGVVTSNNVTQVILTAELPTNDRYEITEIGLYPSGSNPIVTDSDSRTIYTFGATENWEYHTNVSSNAITYSPISPFSEGGVIVDGHPEAIRLNATDILFENEDRISSSEKPRFLDSSIVINGAMSSISNVASGEYVATTESSHIHLAGKPLNLDINTSDDELILAFSVMPKDTSMNDPQEVKILVEFAYSESVNVLSDYAKMQIKLTTGELTDNYRYYVRSKKLGELFKTGLFTWSKALVTKIFVDITPGSGSSASDYYLILDAMRFENSSAIDANPLYGMTAYSAIKNEIEAVAGVGVPIVKESNSVNLVEFRFGFEV